MFLFKFLYRNLKGYRLLVLLAIFVAVLQVSSDIIALQPLKWIPSKAQNPGNDPACTFPFLGLNDNPGILDWFDTPRLDPSLNPPPGGHNPVPPPTSPCPANPSDPRTLVNPDITHHSVIGVIVFSIIVLIVFATLSAALAWLDLFLAAYLARLARQAEKRRPRAAHHQQHRRYRKIRYRWPGRFAGGHPDAGRRGRHHALLQRSLYHPLAGHRPGPLRDRADLYAQHQGRRPETGQDRRAGGRCRH